MSEITILNDENYAEITSSGVVVVDFYADWCGPCRMMAPIFDEAKDAYEGRVTFAKMRVNSPAEDEGNMRIASANKIMSIPTLLFFKDGQLADRVSGVIDKGTLYGKLDGLL